MVEPLVRARPPAHLVEQLQALGLAQPSDFARARRHLRRLAGKGTHFDSVWIDALVQERTLTLEQGDVIKQGAAARLRLGPYLLLGTASRLGPLVAFRARHVDSRREQRVLTAALPARDIPAALARLEQLVQRTAHLEIDGMRTLTEVGAQQDMVWGAHPAVDGDPAASWLARRGRMPPEWVLVVARRLLAALEQLETAGIAHGDLSPRELTITPTGEGVLTAPGFLDAVRSSSAQFDADLPPAALDGLAPERIDPRLRATATSDRFALACLLWQLLAGRSPWPAGDRTTRLAAIARARLPNIRLISPDTSASLAQVIEACSRREPACRPAAYASVQALLAPPRPAERRTASRLAALARPAGEWRHLAARLRPRRRWGLSIAGAAVAIGFVTLLLRPVPARTEPELPQQLTRQPHAGEARGRATPEWVARSPQPTEQAAPERTVAATGARVSYSASPRGAGPQEVQHAGGPRDVVLPTERPLRLASLKLARGQTVRGAAGQRLQISTPPG
ncbi:MAG: protein kinase, partial [Planctomycetaceae bacterium]|nr:protein kinase [Planctomycetaceae bacterium]